MDEPKPRAGANERGYTYRWQKASKAFLRVNPLCVRCKERGRVEPSTVVDHKIPHRGDDDLFWDEANWAPLCKPCHDSFKRQIELRGYSNDFGVDGLPVDASHPFNETETE